MSQLSAWKIRVLGWGQGEGQGSGSRTELGHQAFPFFNINLFILTGG